MIVEEVKKNEEKNEKSLVDLCECYLSLSYITFLKIRSICVPRLLKAAMRKEESEDIQKEVEMALLTLRSIENKKVPKEMYHNEIKEIIEYHQERHNLTQLAYQSAWQFFIYRFWEDKSLEGVVVNELHLAREAARELEELSKCVDWEKKEVERGKEKEELILLRWFKTLDTYFRICRSRNEELIGLFGSIAWVLRASRDNYKEIHSNCNFLFRAAADNRVVEVDILLKGGAVDAVLEEIQRPTLNDDLIRNCYYFFLNVSKRLKEKKDRTTDKAKRKALKKEFLEKMEEEGYEDAIISLMKLILWKDSTGRFSWSIADFL
ncbi:uncharacterized protein MONOS_13578 [Monocercomonoides exilis]|uniref:uncharacterized protein n=1 Tax=Monocercomonoides exilis TaxID=2049356 RepID=UPI00355A70D3|nr:hypothetical protein MONOS_13578 [Monocercomonoides exilis]|eukprot:MONOS_13578.1-p1 / transcript=MONOS_13578.1 / gene=MONOS_13578 / organism=Monocercomonoides_exilis_PA203 / gene_product=unspecified product / transcript_product=unspecified product / location=Mono_scaffold00848:22233-23253(-) / protein_length=321 / sequence_SO=supercontig / SO=protein_coding / is_pseudo=false